ncbi:MAG: alpha/beta hydrolase [Planctomycetota bacterium]
MTADPSTQESVRLTVRDGTVISLDRVRGEKPAYVYLHGLGSTRRGEKSETLLEHARARGRGFVRFDFRGHGESGGVAGHATVSELVSDTLEILESFGPAILVGSSLGGLCAAFAAARAPDAVRALVMLSPALGYLPRMRRHLTPSGELITSEGVSIRLHERVLEDASLLDEEALPRHISVPLLIAHGTADETVPHALSERFFAAVPHGEKDLWLVPGGDHRLSQRIREIYARMDRLTG